LINEVFLQRETVPQIGQNFIDECKILVFYFKSKIIICFF